MIIIIDYGMGNVGSILNTIKYIGGEAKISDNPNSLEKATGIILPGVGAFERGMRNLIEYKWIDPLNEATINKKIPTLGICLGMQLMTRSSEESPNIRGLEWFSAETIKFNFHNQKKIKIPHMGWNTFYPVKDSKLFQNYEEEQRFYFVHSYHVICENKSDISAKTNYGSEFVSAIEKNNIFGLQPHPEKSHKFGMRLFNDFLNLTRKKC